MKRLADYLREEREKKKLTLDDVENATKIKKEHLENIERGKFALLPSESYARAFIASYSDFLGLPKQKVLAFFRRDFEGQKIDVVPKYRKNPINRYFLFQPRFFIILFTGLLVGVYVVFQYGTLLFGPKLTISEPKNGAVIENNVVVVKGKTDPYATVTVENEETYVDLSGNFKRSLYLFSGDKKITIIAKNRFGKETKEIITVKVD